MKYLYSKALIIFLFILSFNSASAQELFETFDTIPLEKFKLTKQEFLDKHSTDDSLRVLINHFYAQRRDGGLMALTIPGTVLAVSAGVATDILLFSNSGGFFIPAFTVLSISVAAPTAIILGPIGTVLFLTHSRKKLYLIVSDYKNGKGLPENYRKVVKRKLEKETLKLRNSKN